MKIKPREIKVLARGRGHCDSHAARLISWSTSHQFTVEFLQECLCYSILRRLSDTTKLPDPRGSLSTTMPLSSIESANAEVKRVIKTKESESSDQQKRGHRTYRQYLSWYTWPTITPYFTTSICNHSLLTLCSPMLLAYSSNWLILNLTVHQHTEFLLLCSNTFVQSGASIFKLCVPWHCHGVIPANAV